MLSSLSTLSAAVGDPPRGYIGNYDNLSAMSTLEHAKNIDLDTPIPKSPTQLRARIGARQDRIAGNVDELVGRIHPKAIATRLANKSRDTFFTEDGDLRPERLAAVGVAMVAVVGVVLRVATHGSRKARKLEVKAAKNSDR